MSECSSLIVLTFLGCQLEIRTEVTQAIKGERNEAKK